MVSLSEVLALRKVASTGHWLILASLCRERLTLTLFYRRSLSSLRGNALWCRRAFTLTLSRRRLYCPWLGMSHREIHHSLRLRPGSLFRSQSGFLGFLYSLVSQSSLMLFPFIMFLCGYHNRDIFLRTSCSRYALPDSSVNSLESADESSNLVLRLQLAKACFIAFGLHRTQLGKGFVLLVLEVDDPKLKTRDNIPIVKMLLLQLLILSLKSGEGVIGFGHCDQIMDEVIYSG